MVEFDFTPIWTAVVALSLYYANLKLSAKCHHIENGKRGIVELWLTDVDGGEQQVDTFVVPVADIITPIEYGDYIHERLERLGVLPL